MSVQGHVCNWTIQGSQALNNLTAGTGHLYKVISANGAIAARGENALGILQYGGANGEHVTLGIRGVSKFVAGAAIAVGAPLAVTTSGYIITADSGQVVVGKNLDSSVASGAVGNGHFDFANNAVFNQSSSHVATYETVSFTAKADLSAAGSVGKAIGFNGGDFANGSVNANGVLYSGTTSGGTSYARVDGKVTMRAGGVVTIGRSLKVTSGWALDADSGDVVVGRAIEASAAGNSGNTFLANVNFASPHYATSCLDIMYQ